MAEEKEMENREVSHWIQSGWINWKKMTGLMRDVRIRMGIKGKLFESVVMTYASETWDCEDNSREEV